jgi:hypothetical protein
MSGLLSAVGGALTTVNVLFGGSGLVTLGSFSFQSMEVPDFIEIGGKHSLAIKKYVGGQRVIDAMGRDDAALTWRGIMLGPTAESRMLELDAIRASGQNVTLAFGTMSYTGVVSEFTGKYRRTNYVEYTITYEVMADNAAQPANPIASTFQQISADAEMVAAYVPSASGAASIAVAAAQAGVLVSGATELGTTAYNAAQGLVTTAQVAIGTGITAAGSTIAALTGATGILGTGAGYQATFAAVQNMAGAVSAAGNLSNLVTASGYLSRLQTNLSNASA